MPDINSQFQSILGRLPTQDERDYLTKFMTEQGLQAHEVGQILQNTPEYQSKLLNQNVDAYGQKLQANDNQILQQGADIAGAQATSRFAGLGRPNSSALAASVFGRTGQLAGNLAQSRQSALAQFYGQGLQNNAALGAQNGQDAFNNVRQIQGEQRQRSYQIEDYYRQQNDYHNELRSAGTRNLQGRLTAMALPSLGDWSGAAAAYSGDKATNPNSKGGDAGAPKGSGSDASAAKSTSGASSIMSIFSDNRLKSNIVPIGKIGPLNAYSYDYRQDMGVDVPRGRQVGFMAQEVEKVHPEAVGLRSGFKTVNYNYLAGVL